MSAVQVNNEKGEPWTKIVSGETGAQCQRFPSSKGILENSSGVAEHVSVKGAPYVFKIIRDEQQHGEKTVPLKINKREFQVDISYVRSVDELTELAQSRP